MRAPSLVVAVGICSVDHTSEIHLTSPCVPAAPGDSPALRITYERGGVVAVLWIGTDRVPVGERWLISPILSRRRFVLDGVPGSPAGGSLDVLLEHLPRARFDRPWFAQVVVLDPDNGPVLSPVVELLGD